MWLTARRRYVLDCSFSRRPIFCLSAGLKRGSLLGRIECEGEWNGGDAPDTQVSDRRNRSRRDKSRSCTLQNQASKKGNHEASGDGIPETQIDPLMASMFRSHSTARRTAANWPVERRQRERRGERGLADGRERRGDGRETDPAAWRTAVVGPLAGIGGLSKGPRRRRGASMGPKPPLRSPSVAGPRD